MFALPAGRRRAFALAALLIGLAVAAGLGWLNWGPRQAPHWLPAFIAPLHAPLAGDPQYDATALRFADVSLRQFVPLALPGTTLRVQVSNRYGDQPLQIGAAHVGWRDGASSSTVRAGSDRPLSFGGAAQVSIAPGAARYSDAVELPAGAPADLAISIYLPQPTPIASWHLVGSRSSYRSSAGNHVAQSAFPVAASDRSLFFVSAVEVDAPADAQLWVAFGDSITDGAWHSVDRDASWPALWAQQWRSNRSATAPVGVLNAGVGGNRLLSEVNGPSGMQRFADDVLDLPALRGVVLLIGTNDLGGQRDVARLPAIVDELIVGQQQLVRQARARGLKVVGATLTPMQGSIYGRPETDAARQHFNRWVRNSAIFDAVADFDAALRDPAQPARIRAEWTSDRLHPNDAGYRVMADVVVRTLAQAGLGAH